LIDWCPVLCRWECAVCAKSWRLDARLPHDDDQTLPASSEIRGRLYNRLKKTHGGDRRSESSPQNEDLKPTAQVLAEQHGVSRATIERDGQFAEAVEELKAIAWDL
jgi:hypothetical protein